MINDINAALNQKDYYALALNAADMAEKDNGIGSLSPSIAKSSGLDIDYLDLAQYLSDGAIDEDPLISLFRRYLLIEKGYEKCGHFFKARLAEYQHIFASDPETMGFGHDRLSEHTKNEHDFSEENIIRILREEARFVIFHGMMRPSYKELLYFDRIHKIIGSGSVLDYCSDNADVALYAAMHNYNVTIGQIEGRLLESLEKRLRLRKLKSKSLIINEQVPLPEIPFNYYNMIFANNSLLNTCDPLLLLEEFRSSLKKNGFLVLSRYPYSNYARGIIADTSGRRKTITDYLEKHFEATSIPEIFKKI